MNQPNIENIYETLKRMLNTPPQRKITMYTGVGGYDLLNEAMENELGFKRLYFFNNKVLRILHRIPNFAVKKSVRGKLYRLINKK